LNEANEKITNHENDLAERDTKIKAYETRSVKMRIANEAGLSYEAIDFLQGDDEESIRKSADVLKGLVGKQPAPPLASKEVIPGGNSDAALLTTLRNIKEKGE
jgi:hypothetical protein